MKKMWQKKVPEATEDSIVIIGHLSWTPSQALLSTSTQCNSSWSNQYPTLVIISTTPRMILTALACSPPHPSLPWGLWRYSVHPALWWPTSPASRGSPHCPPTSCRWLSSSTIIYSLRNSKNCLNPNSTKSSVQQNLRLDYILTPSSTTHPTHPPQTICCCCC